MYTAVRIVLPLLAVVFVATCTLASGETLLAELSRTYSKTDDLTARFIQSAEMSAFGGEDISAGKVTLKKNGRMRWDYEGEDPQQIISDGVVLWIHQVRDRTVIKQRIVDLPKANRLALDLLTGAGEVEENFDVAACGDRCIELKPKSSDTDLAGVTMTLDDYGRISSVATEDLMGNRTKIDFYDLKTNTGISDEIFDFVPPEEIEVLEAEELGR